MIAERGIMIGFPIRVGSPDVEPIIVYGCISVKGVPVINGEVTL
jgi:hypothetical protein